MRDISCPKCGPNALILKKPVFDGLRKTGEQRICASCGHDPGSVAVGDVAPAKPVARSRPSIFDDVVLPAKSDAFAGESEGRCCHRCRHYVVNPFRQWCGLHRRDVEALGACRNFERRPPKEETDPADPPDRAPDGPP